MIRIAADRDAGHDADFHRIDMCQLMREAALGRVDAIVGAGAGFEVRADPIRRRVADRIDLGADVLPERARIRRAGIDPGEPDDRDVEWLAHERGT